MSDFYRDQSVLIAGGLGFIGSHLAIDLVRRGAHVTVVDALLPGSGGRLSYLADVRDRVQIHQVDLRNSHQLKPLVRNQAFVFCLAGQTSHIDSMHEPLLDLELNGRAQLSLLECCRHENPAARIIFTSTRQVYGRAQYLPVDERHPVCPSDINGVHKLATENYLSLYSHVYGMTCSVLRLTNTYGPHMDLHPRKGFVGVFIDRALKGQPIRLFGDGVQLRDFNYVSDVVSALELAGQHVTQGFQLFNLGHDQHCSLRDFVETLNQLIPVQVECQPFPDELKRIDIGDYYGSFHKLQQLTGWQPLVPLKEGLARTIAYYQAAEQNPRRVEQSSHSPTAGQTAGPTSGSTETPTFEIPAFEYRGEMAGYRTELLNCLAGVIDSGKLILGPEVAAFEQEFANYIAAPHAVGVSSGTDALIVALRALEIGPGDEVITVGNGPVPTIAAIRAVGARPRLVDIDIATLQMDVSLVADAINPRTRCILPLHLYGYAADVSRVAELCRDRGLFLIEDCAQAHGTRIDGQHVGLRGDIGCFSFYPTKNLGAFGDAGMCVTRDAELARRMREQACYGFRGDRIAHREGLNCRLDELQAAALRVRLRHLPAALARRTEIAERYQRGLAGLPLHMPQIMPHTTAAWHQFVIRVRQRQALLEHLARVRIGVTIHYATPIHQMPAYESLELSAGSLACTEQACREVLSLPIYPELSDGQVEQVIQSIAQFFASRPPSARELINDLTNHASPSQASDHPTRANP